MCTDTRTENRGPGMSVCERERALVYTDIEPSERIVHNYCSHTSHTRVTHTNDNCRW